MSVPALTTLFATILLLTVGAAEAQQSERFGPYELHYAVVNTTFLEPAVAANYNITRGKKRAILNLSLREHSDGDSAPRAMQLQGRSWDLIQQQSLDFQQIREGPAIYYIAEFRFINEEWRFFEMSFQPENSDRSYTFKFKHQLYVN